MESNQYYMTTADSIYGMMRKYIAKYLEKKFVPMNKWERFKYEQWLIKNWFPFKRLIVNVWHKEIKMKYPDIWKFPSPHFFIAPCLVI